MERYIEGKKFLDKGMFDMAELRFRDGLAEGDVKCSYGLLAVCAMVERDRSEALEVLKNSFEKLKEMADCGDEEACFILGRCYETGSVVERNFENMMKYYTKAAIKNHLDALFNLGCIYMMSDESNRGMALMYYKKAAEQGHAHAQAALEHYEQELKKEL